MAFGERVRELRKERGLSQRDLAGRSGIDFTYLSKIENGRMEPPSEEVIRRVALALGTDADDFSKSVWVALQYAGKDE
jgi:transcriptional regulator with XRE-family HTH domain